MLYQLNTSTTLAQLLLNVLTSYHPNSDTSCVKNSLHHVIQAATTLHHSIMQEHQNQAPPHTEHNGCKLAWEWYDATQHCKNALDRNSCLLRVQCSIENVTARGFPISLYLVLLACLLCCVCLWWGWGCCFWLCWGWRGAGWWGCWGPSIPQPRKLKL